MAQNFTSARIRRPKARQWRNGGRAIGARVREIRLERGIKQYTAMERKMQQQLPPWQVLDRRRLSNIERTGNASAIELGYLAQVLDCKVDDFYEQPYGPSPIPVLKSS